MSGRAKGNSTVGAYNTQHQREYNKAQKQGTYDILLVEIWSNDYHDPTLHLMKSCFEEDTTYILRLMNLRFGISLSHP